MFLFIGLFINMNSVNAQDEESKLPKGLSVSGSLDVYYRTNLNTSSNDISRGVTIAPGTSFANLPGFSLGMANIIGEYEYKKTGMVADFVFGPRGEEAVFGSDGSANIINQLYMYWNVSEKITLTMGNFNTFLGYEVISPTGNYNYSTSYMFSNGPFSHTGLKADFDLGKGFSLMTGVFNTTDLTEFEPNDNYVGGVQLGYSNDQGSAYLNGLFSDDSYQVDLTTGWDVAEKTYLGLNATIADEAFSGAAVYVQQQLKDNFGLGLRYEYFSVDGGNNFNTLTLSAPIKIGSLTIIPEVRVDSADEEVYITSFNRNNAVESSKNLSSFVLAAVYEF